LTVGKETVAGKPGTWIHMAAKTPHSIKAQTGGYAADVAGIGRRMTFGRLERRHEAKDAEGGDGYEEQ
jgi:hypothetical protein